MNRVFPVVENAQISRNGKFRPLPLLLVCVITAIMGLWLGTFIFWAMCILSLLISLPVLYLYRTYWEENGGVTLAIHEDRIEVAHKGGSPQIINRKDIRRIILVRDQSQGRDDTFKSLVTHLFYQRIEFGSDQQIVFTSLLLPGAYDLNKLYSEIPFEEENRFYCDIRH